MPLIKRYPNRKLYDTVAKQYISLEVIADMIRRGEPIQVTDYTTGEDVTTLILVQIIAEQEKRHSGFLPLGVLTSLVQAGGNTLATLRRSLSAPLDLIKQVDEEIQARVEKLVSLGELAEDEGKRLAQRLLALSSGTASTLSITEDLLAQALAERRLPRREDLDRLNEIIDRLSVEVDNLKANQK
jgi:polyhydroxyalkanoate synthesis repressor PhaR